MLRPLGRVAPAPVLRFDDKNPAAVALQRHDVSDWLALVASDAVATVSVTAYPDTLTISGAVAEGDYVRWFAAAGTDGTDHLVIVAWTATSGRSEVLVYRCLVTDPASDVAVDASLGFADQFRAFVAALPGSPAGLSAGELWNNGGTIAIVTA